MLKYKRLPKGTPHWVTNAILCLGGALGLSIAVEGFVGLYGLFGFLATFYYPDADFNITPHQAYLLGAIGVSAIMSGIGFSYLAVFMNRLSQSAIGLSRKIWFPPAVTLGLIIGGQNLLAMRPMQYQILILATFAAAILGGILPGLLLMNKTVAKIHAK